mgnify:CR=1 FL=1
MVWATSAHCRPSSQQTSGSSASRSATAPLGRHAEAAPIAVSNARVTTRTGRITAFISNLQLTAPDKGTQRTFRFGPNPFVHIAGEAVKQRAQGSAERHEGVKERRTERLKKPNERTNQHAHEPRTQQTSKRTNNRTHERTNERKQTKERTNERKQTNERTNERTNEQTNERMKATERTNKRPNERTNEGERR